MNNYYSAVSHFSANTRARIIHLGVMFLSNDLQKTPKSGVILRLYVLLETNVSSFEDVKTMINLRAVVVV